MTDRVRLLRPPDLPRAAALSALVGWNQTEADWAVFLRSGAVRAVDDGGAAAFAATAATLPFGRDLAWISMVLVRPDRRRAGLATASTRWAVDALRGAGTACVALDASPEGREVYRRFGFRDLWGFRRWSLPAVLPAPGLGVPLRPLREADWPALLALDGAAFGAPREFLLRDFAARLPPAALVADGPGGALAGFVLARDGLRAPQIGPLVATGTAVARALLATALATLPPRGAETGADVPHAVIDLCDAQAEVAAWIAAHGAREQRPFTRMALGAEPTGGAPGAPPVVAVAGPEFG
jgi:GNAT superfamily N-acetyltransferase